MREHPKVFCSHRSVDKPRVKEIAERLRAAGIDAWVDQWEIAPGDDLVAKINEGLADYDVGLLFLSKASLESDWVAAEASALTYQRIEKARPVIPVILEADAPVPPLLQPIARLGYEQVEELIDAIYQRGGRAAKKPLLGPTRVQARERSLRITLRRAKEGGLAVAALLDGTPLAPDQEVALGADFAFSYRDFLDNRVFDARKESEGTEREGWAQALTKLGDALGRALFPAAIAPQVQSLLDEAAAKNEAVLLSFETADRELLVIPFEAARLPDGRIPTLESGVRALRRFMGRPDTTAEPLPGPLRILVAVGAPDEGKTPNSVLDVERELQTLLVVVGRPRLPLLPVGAQSGRRPRGRRREKIAGRAAFRDPRGDRLGLELEGVARLALRERRAGPPLEIPGRLRTVPSDPMPEERRAPHPLGEMQLRRRSSRRRAQSRPRAARHRECR